MKKFILLTFGFLGWAFYEMSGGADFEPASVRMAHLNPTPAPQAVVVAELETEAPTETVVANVPTTFIDTDPPLDENVTRVSLSLTSLQEVLEETDATEPAGDVIAQDDVGVPVNAG